MASGAYSPRSSEEGGAKPSSKDRDPYVGERQNSPHWGLSPFTSINPLFLKEQ